MKNYLLLILFSLTIFSCNAQGNKTTKNKTGMDLSFINNKKTKHSIVLMSCDTCAPIRNIGHRVVVELSKKEQEIIKKIKPDIWLQLLNDSTTDFSANLILYAIYSKDAFILYQNNSTELWNKYLKKKDLEYWNNQLKK